MNPVKKLLIGSIHFYQRAISANTPPACRFTPTCSAYAIQAIERFGVIRGTGLAIWRILRCNPWGGHGYDPVPEEKSRKKGMAVQNDPDALHSSEKTGQAADEETPESDENAETPEGRLPADDHKDQTESS